MKVLKITKKHKTKTYHLLMEVTHEELRESGGVITPINFMYMAMADDTSDYADSIVTAPKELKKTAAARTTLAKTYAGGEPSLSVTHASVRHEF